MMDDMHPLEKLRALRAWARTLEADVYTYRRKKWESLLGQVGLMLMDPELSAYTQSSGHLIAFAETGGGSVQFGFATPDGCVEKSTPIAIVVPEMEHTEIIARNFDDFLSIGCINGWSHFEMLAYAERDDIIRIYRRAEIHPAWSWPQKENLLAAIRDEFSLTWMPFQLPG